MCNAELRAAAEAYLKAQDKASADVLVKALEATVSTIDETIGFAESDMGKQVFGADAAAEMAKKGHEFKAAGGKILFLPGVSGWCINLGEQGRFGVTICANQRALGGRSNFCKKLFAA
ncbi:MAG: hypothetical protein IJR85_09860 [Synergistaceae bacterium]|nr:hypothetical protein [Synergistaceae bacterium]